MDETTLTDGMLLERFTDGSDPEAFLKLVRRHERMVFATCRRIVGERSAEDAAQAVFMVFHQKARQIPKGTLISGWLYRTATFVARRAQRAEFNRERHERESAAERERAVKPPQTAALEDNLRAFLDEALERLPAVQRDAIVLRYFDGLSEAEAAHEMGCSAKTISTRLVRGLERLRERLGQHGMVVPAAFLEPYVAQMAQGVPADFSTVVNAACCGKAGGSIVAAKLAEEAMKAMFWIKMKLAAGVACTVAALGVPLTVHLLAGEPAPPQPVVVAKAPANMVSLDVKRADVREVIRTIMLQTNANIVVGPEVMGEVTVKLNKVPWREALQTIMRSLDYSIVDDNEIVRVNSPAKLPGLEATRKLLGTATTSGFSATKVSLDLTRADVREVLVRIANDSKATLVIGPEVTGEVTIRVTDVPWHEALQSVVNSLDYAAIPESKDTFRINSPARLEQQQADKALVQLFDGAKVSSQKISQSFEHADVRDVIGTIGGAANANYVIGPEVTGEVTARFEATPWFDALRLSLAATDFVVVPQANNTLLITSPAKLKNSLKPPGK